MKIIKRKNVRFLLPSSEPKLGHKFFDFEVLNISLTLVFLFHDGNILLIILGVICLIELI